MSTSRTSKKLVLHRSTLRRLGAAELAHAAGGVYESALCAVSIGRQCGVNTEAASYTAAVVCGPAQGGLDNGATVSVTQNGNCAH